ncbi:MAG: hypothetical protein Ta2B_01250 [Termitinemataceae bacterium]|nr:MAG: hypothetical protein Ta2B_01250 [Termitinemataceae bacterium]
MKNYRFCTFIAAMFAVIFLAACDEPSSLDSASGLKNIVLTPVGTGGISSFKFKTGTLNYLGVLAETSVTGVKIKAFCEDETEQSITVSYEDETVGEDEDSTKIQTLVPGTDSNAIPLSVGETRTISIVVDEGGKNNIRYTIRIKRLSFEQNEIKTPIALGSNHAFAVGNDGEAFATGVNDLGQLGMPTDWGNDDKINTFTKVDGLEGKVIKAIVASGDYTVALTDVGTLWVTGDSMHGQLGLGFDNGNYSEAEFATINGGTPPVNQAINNFTQVTRAISSKTITAIAAGGDSVFALDNTGKVWATGWDVHGQLGLVENGGSRLIFTEVQSLNSKNIVAIAVGKSHALALGDNGKVYAAGLNENGQLGLGDTSNKDTFMLVSGLEGEEIIAISAGEHCSFALNENGKLFVAGLNDYGQLGLGDDSDTFNNFVEVTNLQDEDGNDIVITAIASGANYTLVIDYNGKLWAAGLNDEGQLGIDETTLTDEEGLPVEIIEHKFKAFTEVKSLSGKTITAITASDKSSFAIDSDKKAWATGSNQYGQLGLGNYEAKTVFTQVTGLDGKL